jgi:hypothetical protein
MADGNRCGEGCDSSTTVPAVVYFPSGTYKISAPIISWYYSQMIGDAKNIPVIMATPNFTGIAMIGESLRFGPKSLLIPRRCRSIYSRWAVVYQPEQCMCLRSSSRIVPKMRLSSFAQSAILSLTLAKSLPMPMLPQYIGKSRKLLA